MPTGKYPNHANGERSNMWVGDAVGYRALHTWVNRWKGKASCCETCGVLGKRYTWANIDHSYKRLLDDYISMCYSCHKKYDLKYNKESKSNEVTQNQPQS